MKKRDYNKLLTRAVVVLLIFFFVGGIIWGAQSVLEMEGTYEPYVAVQGKSPRPSSSAEIAAYLDAGIANAGSQISAVSSDEDFEIDEDTFTVAPESELMVSAMKLIREDFESLVDNSFKNPSVDFGEEFNGILAPLALGEQDIESAECICEYYECPICGETHDELPEQCEGCQSTEPFIEKLADEYKITIVINDVPAQLEPFFNLRTMQEIEAISADADNCLTHSEPEIEYTKLYVYAVVNRLTDRLTRIEFCKEADSRTTVTFLGDYAELGSCEAGFSYTDKMKYDISYPGVDIDLDSCVVERKKTQQLKAALTCDDPTQYTVSWSSSDSSVASVDEDGVVKATKKDGKATITASFVFKGVTYTDSCEIDVRIPVEKADISKRSLTMAAGEQFTLTATVSPRKATTQTVTWHSSDESVATVSPDGVITAVKPGAVSIFAVSDDGHYKATCSVEVTK